MAFKVIIVGGSLSGLLLALCLERAGIDFELIEKGEIAPQLGASISLHPHSLRILDQLGIWRDLKDRVIPLRCRRHYDENMNCFDADRCIEKIQGLAGRPIILTERCELLRILYAHVKHKSRVYAHATLASYEESESGIVATTVDGRTFHGSILVGADGVHSKTRGLLAEKLRSENNDLSKALTESFTSEYKCMFGVSRNDQMRPFVPDGYFCPAYHDNFSTVTAAGVPGLAFWFLFVKTSLSRTPKCPRYTEDDAKALIGEYGHHPVVPGFTIRDLWDAKVKGGLVSLEEGVASKWHYGRVVMIGDAVHKMTINVGLGGNLAIEGVGRLVNELQPLLQRKPEPSLEELTHVFVRYEETHRSRAQLTTKIAAAITRYEAQDSWLLKIASRWMTPYISDNFKAWLLNVYSRRGSYLGFLPLPQDDVLRTEAERQPEQKGWIRWLLGI